MRQLQRLVAIALVPATLFAQAAKAPAISEAAIVGIFDAANGWDIATGTLASTKASRGEVRDFGTMLAQVHTSVQQQARVLAGKLGVTPTPVARDFPLARDYAATMKKLGGLSGVAFDRAFLEHEVAYHKAVIDAVTKQFLPAITTPDLKAFVEKVAPAFDAHMRAAQTLLDKLPK
ncbi:MAG TPA: DUF4142 domain-containing protein [Gemmatimonadaceae bacterium]|nr:DUF4142 domain-containing protein [Gemmatimonadaceae bacterium]